MTENLFFIKKKEKNSQLKIESMIPIIVLIEIVNIVKGDIMKALDQKKIK